MSSGVPPLGKIVYVCDDIIHDRASRKLHVVGSFNQVRVPTGATFPYALGRICVFSEFAGGLGRLPVEVKVVEASTGTELFGSPVYVATFRGGHAITSVLIRMQGCRFPRPGTYLVQLYCQGTFIDDRRLTVV